MPPVGRPPAERSVHTFEGVLLAPHELVLDTSFVVDALVRTQPRHAACSTFLAAIADTGGIVYYNSLLEVELWEAAYATTLRALHGGRWRDRRTDGRCRRPARRLRNRMEDAWNTALDALNAVRIEVSEVASVVPQMMGYGLGSSDAVHAATARYADVLPFVTLDFHFTHVPQRLLDLYVPEDRVRACRRSRRLR
jgi:predicted nucleic acid-binding protein